MYHKPVLLKKVLKYWVNVYLLSKKKRVFIVDATCGEGGHSLALLKKAQKEGWLNKLKLICLDWDEEILKRAKKRLAAFSPCVIFKNCSYLDLDKTLSRLKIKKIDGILFDLGASSFHFKKAKKGFSFQEDSLLDMRYSKIRKETALDIVRGYSKEEIAEILKVYGEERWAKKIAEAIISVRSKKEIRTARELAEIVAQAVPRKFWGKTHPATKTFQALRIYVNKELDNVQIGVKKAVSLLSPQARILVISFHSLEDRLVKRIFRLTSEPKKDIIFGRVLKSGSLKNIGRFFPSCLELEKNPASRSAVLRVAEKRGGKADVFCFYCNIF